MQSKILTASALVAGVSASANYLGFNSGSTHADGSAKVQSDFEHEMTTAQNLHGAPGLFNAVRLYTNIQGSTTTDPISAFPAAIATNSSLLLGIWTSGTTSIDNELNALKAGLTAHGKDLADRVIGVSIGSEDLYRNGVTGTANDAGVGANPDAIVKFIKDFKNAFADTPLKNVPIGHVDTWDAWTNGSNKAVIDAVDWLGVDEYPYYQTGDDNTIENAAKLFDSAYESVVGVAGKKSVWVTETGWPYQGKTWDKAVASKDNARKYWDSVGCDKLFGKVPTFWYNLVDDSTTNTMSFAVTDNLNTTPLFDISCPKKKATSSSSSVSAPSSTAKATSTDAAGKKTSGSQSSSASEASATGADSSSSSSSGSGSDSSSSSSGDAKASSTTGSDASSSSVVAANDASAAKLGSSAFAAIAFVAAAFALF